LVDLPVDAVTDAGMIVYRLNEVMNEVVREQRDIFIDSCNSIRMIKKEYKYGRSLKNVKNL